MLRHRWHFERRSLGTRLTAWFALSSFLLLLIATAALYWTVTSHLRSAESHLVIDRIRTLQSVLRDDGVHLAELVEEVEHEWPGGPNAHIFTRLMDGSGRVLTETHGMSARDLPVSAFPPPDRTARVPNHSLERREADGRHFRLYAVRLAPGTNDEHALTLQLAVDATDHDALLANYRRQMVIVLTLMFFGVTAVGFIVARSGLRPIERFEETLRHIRSTTLHERLDPSGIPMELSLLATTCNEMLDGLEEAFSKLSRFSADIAHELRTPINNLRGEIEVTLARQRPREEYRSVLESCLEEAQRVSQLIDSLLFLARAEGAELHPRWEPLDLQRELLAVAEFYDALASEAGVTLTVESQDSLVANVDRALFQSAVGNLVANAIHATPRGGDVKIRAAREGRDARIDVADAGCGIDAADLPRVFDRLFRTDVARNGGASGGAGLGLAIVKSIAQVHRGSASIRSSVNSGTVATLRLPADMTTS
jgi:two-component system heavy metal sensor histidine kinase CusS